MYCLYSSTKVGASPSPASTATFGGGMEAADDADYVFELQGNCDGTLVAASLSSRGVAVHDAETLQHVHTLRGMHSDRINGMEFMRANPSVLVTSSDDETVRVWDTRCVPQPSSSNGGSSSGNAQAALSIKTSGEVMDVSVGPNDAMLACAVGNGVSFFDVRGGGAAGGGHGSASLGEYADVNTDTVTQLRFHPTRPAELVTAGDDGLVCMFNTAVGSGEEAVCSVFNTDCPVQRFGFFGHNLEGVYCVSSVETLSAWHAPSAQRIGTFPDARDALGVDYLVDCMYSAASDSLTLLGGTHSGEGVTALVAPTGLQVTGKLDGGHGATIRSVLCTRQDAEGAAALITGGEDSALSGWKRGQTAVTRPGYKKEERRKSKKESRRFSPY